jgi:hypothetical protein
MVGGERRLNQLRDQAREVAQVLGYESQFKRLNILISALLGTQAAQHLTARQALARAAGRPYDPHRLEIFEALLTELNRSSLAEVADPAQSGVARENFAFENRSEDSHDILGTFNAAALAPWRDQPPQTADDFLYWLRSVNALVMQKRADKKPGKWKDKANQAGSTCETQLASIGVTLELRSHILSHDRSGAESKHYDRYSYLTEKRLALTKWARHLGLATDLGLTAKW